MLDRQLGRISARSNNAGIGMTPMEGNTVFRTHGSPFITGGGARFVNRSNALWGVILAVRDPVRGPQHGLMCRRRGRGRCWACIVATMKGGSLGTNGGAKQWVQTREGCPADLVWNRWCRSSADVRIRRLMAWRRRAHGNFLLELFAAAGLSR